MIIEDRKIRVNISKLMAKALRHRPDVLGIVVDEHGWTDVNDMIDAIRKKYQSFNLETLECIVEESEKKRYSFNENHTKIRANQGHSLPVDVELKIAAPPDVLYHGTARKNIETISAEGIKRMNRLYVHLSADIPTALNVGSRHGAPAVFEVDSRQMNRDGYQFYLAENGVWLSEFVPSQYIRLIEPQVQ